MLQMGLENGIRTHKKHVTHRCSRHLFADGQAVGSSETTLTWHPTRCSLTPSRGQGSCDVGFQRSLVPLPNSPQIPVSTWNPFLWRSHSLVPGRETRGGPGTTAGDDVASMARMCAAGRCVAAHLEELLACRSVSWPLRVCCLRCEGGAPDSGRCFVARGRCYRDTHRDLRSLLLR